MEIDLSQFQINRFKIEIRPLPGGMIKIMPMMYVPAVGDSHFGAHRHGDEIDLTWNEPIPAAQWEAMDAKAKAEFVVKMALKLLDHELREQLCVDGERPLYPHPGTPPPAYQQYQPTRKQFRPTPAWDRYPWATGDLKMSFDFKGSFTEGRFFVLDESHSMRRILGAPPSGMGKAPAKLPPAAPEAKPPRSRYLKPKGGFPGQDLVRPKGRDRSHSRGVR